MTPLQKTFLLHKVTPLRKPLLLLKGCINIQSERWRSMVATPGEGEQAKGGERQDVARALSPSGYSWCSTLRVSLLRLTTMDGRLACTP